MVNSRATLAVLLALCGICFHEPALGQPRSYAVFRSEDGGRTWTRSAAGLRSDARINAFGSIGAAVLAGTDQGIFVSGDQGVSWELAGGTAVRRILSFATLGTSVYAGTDADAILVSLDGGVNWTANGGLPFRKIRSLLAYDGVLYAGTDAQGVYISRDGGLSWSPMGQGLPAGAQVFTMAGLKGKVFAGLYSKGLYASADQGLSWRKVAAVSPLVLATTGDTLLAGHNPGGIFRSVDAGETWMKVEIAYSDDLGNAPVWEAGAGPALAVAGVASRIYHSEDRGRTWKPASAGLPNGSSGISFIVNKAYVLAGVSIASNPGNRPNK